MIPSLPPPPLVDKEDFRMYYQHQYERMSQLEQQRLIFTNLILGLSLLSFSVAFADISKLNVLNAGGLPIAVIISNWIAILFNRRSRSFIKMHQARAEKALEIFAPELDRISRQIASPINSNRDWFRRAALQNYVHIAVMLIALLPIAAYFKWI